MTAGEGTQRVIEKEIVGERAGSLTRAVEALERALLELFRFDDATVRGPPKVREHLIEKVREHLLEEARERLWFVIVQREAIGLARHDVLYEVFEIPAEVRRHMGPRRPSG